MEFTIKSGSPEKQRSACVVVGVFDNRKPSLSADLIDRASGGYISEIIRRGDMEGKLGSTTHIGGRELISFSSFNYLGMSVDKRVMAASNRTTRQAASADSR